MKKQPTKKSRVTQNNIRNIKKQGSGFSVASGSFIDTTDEAFNGGIVLDLTWLRKNK